MKKIGVDQIPIVDNDGYYCFHGDLNKNIKIETFFRVIVGVVTLKVILTKLVEKKIEPSDSIENIIIRVYPKLYNTTNLGVVSRILEVEAYVVILEKQG